RPKERQYRAVNPQPTPPRASWLAGKLAAIAVLGMSIALLRWLLIAPQFQVATILISGNDLVPADAIAAELPLQGANLFSIRGPRLAKNIERNPAVAQARVRPRLPNLLAIEIEEREPGVVWDAGDTQWLVDNDGRVLGSGERELPTIAAPPVSNIEPGRQVDVGVVRMARAVTPRLAELGLN